MAAGISLSANPLARLLGMLLPLCRTAGAAGLAEPRPVDILLIAVPARNAALAAPSGFGREVDITVPRYATNPTLLYAVLRDCAAVQPRTYLAAAFPEALQLHWVARSKVLNFPDRITGQVLALEGSASSFVLYSRSVYGYSDLGVNRQRLTAWLAAVDRAVSGSGRR